MNDNHFSHDKEKFFTYFVQQNNLNTQIINKLFSISPNNLDSSLSDNKDFDIILFFGSELGGYLSILIELVIKHKEEYLNRIKKSSTTSHTIHTNNLWKVYSYMITM